MWDGHRRHGLEPFGHLRGRGPRHRGTPVVSDQMHLLRTAGVDQRADIADQFGDAVVAATGRAGARRVAPLVGRQTAVALRGQAVDDGVPAVVVLGEAVQQHHDRPVGGPGIADIEGQAVVAVVVHSSRVHACSKELYAGSVELVDIGRATGHAHDQGEC